MVKVSPGLTPAVEAEVTVASTIPEVRYRLVEAIEGAFGRDRSGNASSENGKTASLRSRWEEGSWIGEQGWELGTGNWGNRVAVRNWEGTCTPWSHRLGRAGRNRSFA